MTGTATLDEVLERLRSWAEENNRPAPRRSGTNWSACCPAHDDHRPSLSVGPGDQHPFVLHCHAGCEPGEVMEALGLKWQGTSRSAPATGSIAENPTRPEPARIEHREGAGALVHYNLEGWGEEVVGLRPKPERRTDAEPPQIEADRGSFEDRVIARRVNLVEAIERGLPPLDFLPASEEMFVRGKRHAIAAPYKQGKSIAILVHAVDMVLAGARVAILDRENGSQLYALRLRDTMDARKLSAEQRTQLWDKLAYYDFPTLRDEDAGDLVEHLRSFDLVVFDSQRKFLSNLGLQEDSSDDYSRFMDSLVDPLFRAGVATLLLDNTGHTNKKRGRGSSSKGDLNEVLFSLKTAEPFDVFRQGRIELTIEDSRFGNTGSWSMAIGGGSYGSFAGSGPVAARDDFRAAAEAVLKTAEEPMGADRVVAAARESYSVQIKTADGRHLLRVYAASPSSPITHTEKGFTSW